MAVQDTGPEMAIVSTTIENDASAYVDWPAIVAGAVIASAISFVLFTFGTAVGLSITSPYPAESVSATTFAIVLGLWMLWVTVLSFLVGGYFTGLLIRQRAVGDHEREMRDGMHGALSWALAVLLGALIAAWTAGGVARTGAEAAGQAATVAATTRTMPTEYFADMLLRSDNPAAAASAETDSRRGEVLRILQRNPSGEIATPDQTYLTQLAMRQTGLPEADAKNRVDSVVTEYRNAVAAAQQAAEKARKFALLLGFALAATLALGAGAAWWAAVQGGEHRDQRYDMRPYVWWRKRPVSGQP